MNQPAIKIPGHPKKTQYALTGILVLFFILELVLFTQHNFPLLSEESDGIGFMQRATGPVFQEQRQGPGYSLAIRLFNYTGMGLFASAKTVSMLFGVLLIVAAWRVIASISNPQTALFAVLLFAFHPALTTGSIMIMSDVMAAALFFTSLAVLMSPRVPGPGHFLGAGLLAGAAWLTRSIYIILVLLPVLYGLFVPLDKSLKKKAAGAVLYLTGFVLIALPWFIYLFQTRGDPLWTMNHLNIAFKMFSKDQGWNAFPTQDQYGSIFALFAAHPVLFVQSWARTFISLPVELVKMYPVFGIFSVFGFFAFISRVEGKKLILLLVLAVYGALVSLVWINERFLLVFIPLTALFVVLGLRATPKKITIVRGKSELKIPLNFLLYPAVLLIFLFYSAASINQFLTKQPVEYKRAAEWLKQHARPDDTVLAAKPHIPFFSTTQCLFFRMHNIQNISFQQLDSTLSRIKPDFLVFDERYSARHFPALKPLLEPNKRPVTGTLSKVFFTRSPEKVVIYRYNKNNSENSDISQNNN